MTNFRTEVNVSPSEFKISYEDQIFMIGSCFSENIGEFFDNSKFNCLSNPYGIMYNPSSVYRTLHHIMKKRVYSEEDLIYHNELYHSLDHHGKFSQRDPKKMIDQINTVTEVAHDFLKNATVLFITFGTAWVYVYRKTTTLAANCHKIPAKEFIRQRLSVHQIVDLHSKLIAQLKEINPNVQIIYTVSPVRHLKDGFVENTSSKSILHMAKDQLVKRFENVSYFPSYEIMMDDLRDYRFYNEDMVHPSPMAVKYIWQLLQNTFFDASTKELYHRIQKIDQAFHHCPRNPQTAEYEAFCQKNLNESRELQKRYSNIDLSEYINYFTKRV